MLQVIIPESESYDEVLGEFITIKRETFQIEHSLVSLSKWESKWNIPFFGKDVKTKEQILDYIRCMTITQNINPNIYLSIPQTTLKEISDYISASMTATWFSEKKNKENGEVVTSEIIYYWMITHNIPMECQKWHINRLLTLVRVCNIKNAPPKKMNKKEMLSERRQLNAARRNESQTKG